jgi:cyclase
MADAYGKNCVVLSIDAKRVTGTGSEGTSMRWNAFSHCGRTDAGLDAIEWAVRAVELGAGEIIINSIDADGTGAGYDLELIRRVKLAVQVPVVASGGAGTLEQIANVLLSTANPEMEEGRGCPISKNSTTEDTEFHGEIDRKLNKYSFCTSTNDAPGADAALVASILHFGKTTIEEIKRYAQAKGVSVKL